MLLTDAEFKQVLNHLDKGSVFDRAHTLRDKMALRRDSVAELPSRYKVEGQAIPGDNTKYYANNLFDECHRSQFGDTHKRITEYFNNYQLFGFTGTPIFADDAPE
ncbi:MAG: DEAD/DEAH box helicase family protein [Thiolinea sp.]